MDLTPLVRDETLTLEEFVRERVARFEAELAKTIGSGR
jgi:hypothetical protein